MTQTLSNPLPDTAPAVTVHAVDPSGPGALAGWQMTCTCGTTLSTSLSERAARVLGQEHLTWHANARPARKR